MSAAPVLNARRILAVFCLMLLCVLLTAGLWPFHAPRNRVAWARGGGVRLGGSGTVFSSARFPLPPAVDGASASLEIWLQPSATKQEGTIIAFEGSASARRFSMRQSEEDLVLQVGRERVFVDRVFARRDLQVITLTESPRGVSVFVNGILSRPPFAFPLSNRQFTGRLVLGTSVIENDSWSGVVRGIALYGHALTPSEVIRQDHAWTAGAPPDSGAEALYLFDEGHGRVIRNTGSWDISLEIPEHFAILHQTFLERPWTEIHFTWSYAKDFLINIGGFIPFGFALSAYFAARSPGSNRVLLTVILGFAVSLTIEVWQSFLPTRFSGMTDLVTNTSGTWMGVAIYKKVLLNRLGFWENN